MEKLDNIEQIEKGKVILMFSAIWCGDCYVIDNFIDEVVDDNPEYQFYKVDVDHFPSLQEKYDILGIPSFVALEDSVVKSAFISKLGKTKPEVEEWIAKIK